MSGLTWQQELLYGYEKRTGESAPRELVVALAKFDPRYRVYLDEIERYRQMANDLRAQAAQ